MFDSLLDFFRNEDVYRLLTSVGLTTMMLIMLVLMSRMQPYRRIFAKFLRLFLYEESGGNESVDLRRDYDVLRKKIRSLEKTIAGQDQLTLAEEQISTYLEENLSTLIDRHLTKGQQLEKPVIAALNRTVAAATHEYLTSKTPAELELDYSRIERAEATARARGLLERDLGAERRSAATLRTVMINLFVVFNLGLLITYVVYGQQLEGPTLYTIGGSYLSLVAFIVYIVRSSHFRTGVLLAIRENSVNQAAALSFLEHEMRKGSLGDADVEVARMLLINRTEREQHAHHPYEVILKQVEGTNIQFKGGKMSIGSSKQSK